MSRLPDALAAPLAAMLAPLLAQAAPLANAIAARIPPAPDARTATRAARALNARRRRLRREALIAHLASFGPHARGLDRLTQGERNA